MFTKEISMVLQNKYEKFLKKKGFVMFLMIEKHFRVKEKNF